MNRNILFLLIGICLGLIGYNKFLDIPNEQTEILLKQIDTVYQDREKFIRDTIIVRKNVVINHYDTVEKKLDSVFNSDNDSLKQSYFDFEIPSEENDTLRKISATNSQAKLSIEYKNLWTRDSSLLDICEDNVKNCDGSMNKIKTKLDSLENIKPESHMIRDVGIGFGLGILIFGLFSFLR